MKTVLIYSGGLDSTSLLFKLLKEGDSVKCLNFNYGSKHNEYEAKAAKKIVEIAKVEIQHITLDCIGQLFKSSLLKTGEDIPHGYYAEPNMKKTVVPFRNAIMLSIAGGYAASIGFDRVAAGIHAGDHTIYPDCRIEFVETFKDLLRVGLWEKVNFYTPFAWKDKGDVAIEGYEAGAPIFETYSCYEGGEIHCGVCGACNERKYAFDKLKKIHEVEDKTIYRR